MVRPVQELKILRCKNSMSQADVAEKLNITKSTYNRKENGLRNFTVHEALSLARLFNVQVEEIFLNS